MENTKDLENRWATRKENSNLFRLWKIIKKYLKEMPTIVVDLRDGPENEDGYKIILKVQRSNLKRNLKYIYQMAMIITLWGCLIFFIALGRKLLDEKINTLISSITNNNISFSNSTQGYDVKSTHNYKMNNSTTFFVIVGGLLLLAHFVLNREETTQATLVRGECHV